MSCTQIYLPINRAEGPPIPSTVVGTGATGTVRRLVLKSLISAILGIGGGSGRATLGEDALLLGRLGGSSGSGLLLDLVLDGGLDLGDGLPLLLGNGNLLLLIGLVIRQLWCENGCMMNESMENEKYDKSRSNHTRNDVMRII